MKRKDGYTKLSIILLSMQRFYKILMFFIWQTEDKDLNKEIAELTIDIIIK